MRSEKAGNASSMSPVRLVLSLLLKCTVIVSAAVGTYISAGGRQAFMSGTRAFMYFTIQSNIAVALISLVGIIRLIGKAAPSRVWTILQFVGAVAITLTGMVFCFMLAPTFGRNAWSLPNVLTHVVVPIAAVLDFFLSGTRGQLKKRDALYGAIPPLAYAIYAGIGYLAHWEFSPGVYYPYYFLNGGSPAGAFGFIQGLPFMGCVWWILALALFLFLVGRLYIALLNRR